MNKLKVELKRERETPVTIKKMTWEKLQEVRRALNRHPECAQGSDSSQPGLLKTPWGGVETEEEMERGGRVFQTG